MATGRATIADLRERRSSAPRRRRCLSRWSGAARRRCLIPSLFFFVGEIVFHCVDDSGSPLVILFFTRNSGSAERKIGIVAECFANILEDLCSVVFELFHDRVGFALKISGFDDGFQNVLGKTLALRIVEKVALLRRDAPAPFHVGHLLAELFLLELFVLVDERCHFIRVGAVTPFENNRWKS